LPSMASMIKLEKLIFRNSQVLGPLESWTRPSGS